VTATVAGADGCRAGWVVAVLHPPGAGPRLDLTVVPSIGPVVDDVAAGRLAALAVDMPIGLPESGPRACDVAARRTLGPRRSSVFPAPVRAVLGTATYAEALARSRAASGRGLSKQAFNLVPAIAELDAALTPARRAGVVEAHPEMAFARLAGAPCAHPKRTAEGRAERLALLAAAGLGDLSTVRLPGSAPDDVLDAAVLTLTAARAHAGTADRLGDGTLDARGLAMEVVV
jgi:predicted RNase H-like nuclease